MKTEKRTARISLYSIPSNSVHVPQREGAIMRQKGLYSLSIDKSFSTLIHPLSRDERHRLEENLRRDGCIDPIIVWNNVILDGHNRYSICTENAIPFAVEDLEFSSRQEAIAWICANQLGRRNINDETRKYLIGKQYEAEKIANQLKNRTGRNQYSTPRVTSGADSASDLLHSSRITARIVADKNNVSSATVKRCAAFSRAIDLLEQKDSELAKSILAGERRLSQREVIELASMRPSQIRRATFQKPQNETADGKKDASPVPAHAGPSVKDMPKFDPDGELTALTLTVPSWRESIDRVIAVADIGLVSATAKKRMRAALTELVTSAERLKVLIDCSEEAK